MTTSLTEQEVVLPIPPRRLVHFENYFLTLAEIFRRFTDGEGMFPTQKAKEIEELIAEISAKKAVRVHRVSVCAG